MPACVEVAFLLKDVLAGMGLESFAKLSGSKGLQIYVPLNTAITYEATQPFAREIAEILTQRYPDRILSQMAKSERANKVFIDWSQNADFKTTVGVYSLRAKAGRPFVSMPVAWDELERASPVSFEPEEALARLAELGDLFAPVLTRKQKLPSATRRRRSESRQTATAPKTRSLPASAMQFVEPMQAKLVSELPEGSEWRYEVKLDGYRGLAIKQDGKVHLLSRRNRPLNDQFPAIAARVAALEDGLILDGEIVALDSEGRPAFHLLQHRKKTTVPVVFYAFDILARREKMSGAFR